ncbi:hypothetical protein E2C01_085297 [Portunus trituberculatus]|uniref:Uncharacterized protein n=1 Tax=Portunus trituberculatus TaxID=210409 RepID=A0A5B7J0L1_PORTR|nr:hypothetical protein [Portunus trituberculatus]
MCSEGFGNRLASQPPPDAGSGARCHTVPMPSYSTPFSSTGRHYFIYFIIHHHHYYYPMVTPYPRHPTPPYDHSLSVQEGNYITM